MRVWDERDVTLADNGKITYQYDDKRQVIGAVQDNDTSYTYAYSFDRIGNWITGQVGRLGQTPESKAFTPNNLNQYNTVSSVSSVVHPTYDANG
jgi:hypothetical protein